MVLFLGIGPPFVNPGVFPSGQHLDSHQEAGIVTVVGVHPAQRCTSPLGVVLVGSEGGVGDCHDAANLSRKVFFLRENFILFVRVWFLLFLYC